MCPIKVNSDTIELTGISAIPKNFKETKKHYREIKKYNFII